jgi:hypothetical protein
MSLTDQPSLCRFCDQPPTLGSTIIKDHNYFIFSCLRCHADGFPSRSREEAARDWNERYGKHRSEPNSAQNGTR